jgi:GntR family transcriptional regulator
MPSEDRVPAYFRIKQDILEKIQGKIWAAEQKLPPEAHLQALYGGVSRGTLRRAMLELELEGYIRREQGRGTFVAARTPTVKYQLGQISSFSQQVLATGLQPSTRVLEKGIVAGATVPANVREAYRLSVNVKVIRIRRVRLGNGVPIALQVIYLQATRFPGILDEDLSSLFRLYLERYRIQVTAAEQVLQVRPPTKEEGRLLQLKAGTPVFERDRVSYDRDDEPFEVLHSVDAGDKFEYRYRIVQDDTQVFLRPTRAHGDRE